MSENDTSIKVNILTGRRDTSQNHNYNDENVYRNVFFSPYVLNIVFEPTNENVLENSLYDQELVRNNTITLNVSKQQCSEGDLDIFCGICKEKFKLLDSKSVLESCNHVFHYDCIIEWGKYKQECPLCRSNIPIL